MPKDTYKSAAVPFVNQKGERSMKKVKVERYVAGKKPAYARDEDEDDEYYTTDEGEEESEVDDESAEESQDDTEDGHKGDDDDEEDEKVTVPPISPPQIDEDEDDDPRFRKLKQLETKPDTAKLLNVQTSVRPKIEDKNLVIDDEEDEDEIRLRHSIARARTLNEPVGLQIGTNDQPECGQRDYHENQQPRRLETEDILGDLKLTGIKSKHELMKEEEAKRRKNISDMLEQAKQEAVMKEQVMRKIEEDNKKEMEKEALDKNDFSAYEMAAANTDDEDEELAYEEWKLREIKRVQRDRSERVVSS